MHDRTGASRPGRLPLERYRDGILNGDRVMLARAITLIESDLPADEELSARLLDSVLSAAGHSRRIGITGVPGAGKSSFIDTFGLHIVRERAERVAVLSVDPSSPISGGSILGDKTRMERLCREERAFIRPSAARGQLGGVARRTREAILLCEAAGFSNILVETVGVGQSETSVRSMTDFFLLLTIAGAGDALQGIKRGIIEMIDVMAVNKADGENKPRAERARIEYASALRLFPAPPSGWTPRVVTCSALTGDGVAEIWRMVLDHEEQLRRNGYLAEMRSRQALAWMRELVSSGLEREFRTNAAVARHLPLVEDAVSKGRTSPFAASRELLAIFQTGVEQDPAGKKRE